KQTTAVAWRHGGGWWGEGDVVLLGDTGLGQRGQFQQLQRRNRFRDFEFDRAEMKKDGFGGPPTGGPPGGGGFRGGVGGGIGGGGGFPGAAPPMAPPGAALGAGGRPPLPKATNGAPTSGVAQGGESGGAQPPRLREFFPETMLWKPALITDDKGIAT